jgi:Tfp pilus assembly protein PilO
MKPQANRKQSWLVLAAIGGLVAAYAHFFYLPGNRKMAEMKGELAEAELQAEGDVHLIAALDATQRQLDAATEYTEAWQAAAPSEHGISEVFERIHELTRLAETETTRFEPESVVAYETFRRIPVSMECEGSFAQLAAVLTALENMREPIWLRGVEIQSTGQDGELARAEISLDVFADNLEDSDQENLSGKPITQEVAPYSTPL